MSIDRWQIEAAGRRFEQRRAIRDRNLKLIKAGRGLSAETPERIEKFLARRGIDPKLAAHAAQSSLGVERLIREVPPQESVREAALERVIGHSNLMGVSFLERGLIASRSVARVWIDVNNGRAAGFGTGFLISPRLLMTNDHVLGSSGSASQSLVEFDYQVGLDDQPSSPETFTLSPGEFFFHDRDLDYAIVAVQARNRQGRDLRSFGWSSLFEEEGKAVISQWLNIIQHPGGEPKQVALRENQLVDLLDQFLHYSTDTSPGSSGSPVFNDRWEVVGLHHSGVWEVNAAGEPMAIDGEPWRPEMGEHRIKWKGNEGARVSRIIKHVRDRQKLNGAQRQLFDEALRNWGSEALGSGLVNSRGNAAGSASGNMGGTGSILASGPNMGPDGTATWTIPVTFSINVGGNSGGAAVPSVGGPPTRDGGSGSGRSGGPTGPGDSGGGDGDETAALAEAVRKLGHRDDVLGVRLGYVFKDGWITSQRAVVVTVKKWKSPAELRESGTPAVPESILGLPVEVTSPTIGELLRAGGHSMASEAFGGRLALQPHEITYNPPAGAALQPVTDNMRVIAHVSPDAGWPTLSAFLADTKKKLTIGMYDFGAPHIFDAIAALADKPSMKVSLVMQRGQSVGSGTKKDDMTDQEVIDGLTDAFGDRFEHAWVKIGVKNGWVASSYHIKVAVRDGAAFWLSSGNWQSSNQPDARPLDQNPPVRSWLTKYNRDWHAIVEHKGLAKTFEVYLRHDLENNQKPALDEALAMPLLLMPESVASEWSALERAKPFKYFPPFEADRQFTVTPLLTPDNYHKHVLKLVRSARERLWIQNQTFKAPTGDQQKQLGELIDAVMDRQKAGVDVRVIFRVISSPDAREVLENLADYGFDTDVVRVQTNCHTKAIVVDDDQVLIGSQNWSSHGVSLNRDASLLFKDTGLTKYFAGIIDHDWNNLARQKIGSERSGLEVLTDDAQVGDGLVLDWKDYMETL